MIPLRDEVPTRRFPAVTVGLIVINLLIHLYQIYLPAQAQNVFIYKWAFIPVEYTHFVQVYAQLAVPYGVTVFSSMFLHGGFFHLIFNMLYLWIFGNNIEDFFGPVKYIGFYLISGIFAIGLYTVTDPNSDIPLIGASGAIAGLLGAYLVLYPQARIQTLLILGIFIQFVRVPAKILLGFWIAIQILSGLFGLFAGASGGTAWFAHIGGFAFGYFYFKLTRKRPKIWGFWN